MKKIRNDIFAQKRDKAREYKYLYHYTNLESLIAIIGGKSLRLSRIDKVNDQVESKRITSCWKDKVFLLCFTHTTINKRYCYKHYGRIRLRFKNKRFDKEPIFYDKSLNEECKIITCERRDLPNYYGDKYTGDFSPSKLELFRDKNEWQIYDSSFADVYYCNDIDDFFSKEGFEKHAGLIKQKIGRDEKGSIRKWKIERETRLRLTMEAIHYDAYNEDLDIKYAKPPFEYLYMRLPEIEEISLSPNMERRERNKVEDYLKENGLYHLLK